MSEVQRHEMYPTLLLPHCGRRITARNLMECAGKE